MRDELLRLAELLETAAGPDRWLDARIGAGIRCCPEMDLSKLLFPDAATFEADDDGSIRVYGKGADGEMRPLHRRYAPNYTASLDAALTLLPTGWGFMLRQHETSPGPMRACGSALCPSTSGLGDQPFMDRWSATPALALCAAALRARAALEPDIKADMEGRDG